MNDSDYYKKRLENFERERKEEKQNKVSMGKLLMSVFGILVIYAFFPWREKEYTDVHFGLSIAGFIWGFVVWRMGKDSGN